MVRSRICAIGPDIDFLGASSKNIKIMNKKTTMKTNLFIAEPTNDYCLVWRKKVVAEVSARCYEEAVEIIYERYAALRHDSDYIVPASEFAA